LLQCLLTSQHVCCYFNFVSGSNLIIACDQILSFVSRFAPEIFLVGVIVFLVTTFCILFVDIEQKEIWWA
jgi:hypothetical protein